MKLEKLNYIDAIRGIAILMVIVHHTAQQGTINAPYPISVILSLGTRGVQLFFIASAFTLFRSYKNRNSFEKSPTKNFFIRRFFRIAPIYYLAIIYFILHQYINVPYWLGNQPYISVYNKISNILFLHGFSPYWINSLVPGGWSIAVEMMFYALFPFLFLKIKTINDAFIFLNITLIFKLIFQEFFNYFQFIPSNYLKREFLFYYFPSQLPVFAMGIIMFFLIENIKSLDKVSIKIKLITFFLLLLQVGSTFDFLYLNHLVFGILFLIFGILLSKGKLSFITNSLIRYIGKISFSMYIIHFIVISWLKYFNLIDFTNNYFINYLTRFSLIVTVSMFISTITYKLVEIPFQNFAKSLIRKMETN
jgi:peptidoglycan/LPS O-acetylase OafA/YrhL